jgi:hypothetical protein
VINDATNIGYSTGTNDAGIYSIQFIPPGKYHFQVSKNGFKNMVKPDVILHVQDALTINFTLELGAASESVTVEGGAPLINTESAAVSTVVDRRFIENMPLNGRSFQDLIRLTPGVVTNTPQSAGAVGETGEFNVNGQRTESNYYTVDGVSANVGISTLSLIRAGSVPLGTAQGTTQSLVSIDALEEFRVQTSSYSAEYGRSPGGQISLVTRSGTNQWHGTTFNYLRNDIFDANDWFNNYFGQPGSPERQNDFGATLGGPVRIPVLYNGKGRTFFFFSYEGLRLVQPQSASVNYVPTVALRQSAPSALQPVLNAFPLPNCPSSATSCTNDHGNGLGDFISTWSNPSQIDSYSVRLDHSFNDKLKIFFRFGDAPSSVAIRGGNFSAAPSSTTTSGYAARTYTLGASGVFSSRISNEFRLNFTSNENTRISETGSFGGGQAVDLAMLQGIDTATTPAYQVVSQLRFGGFRTAISQGRSIGRQSQWNAVNALSLILGSHQLKFGVDFRRLAPALISVSPSAIYQYFNQTAVQANSANSAQVQTFAPFYPIYSNFSAFAQDQWTVAPSLTLSMGLRWEVNPAPGAANGNLPYTVRGGSLSTLTLAPQGTPLWNTTWYNIAPRLGAAYVLRKSPGWETVVRGGGGVFFDTGQQTGSSGFAGPGFSAIRSYRPASFPLSSTQLNIPIVNPPVAPYPPVYAYPTHLQLPYTLQANGSFEQALGKSQALTVSYVGAFGRRLLQLNAVQGGPLNPNFTAVQFYRNGLTSDYNALQLQLQRRMSRGLQALASYTWSHSIDYGSTDVSFPYQRGSSDFDVRHSFSAALSYDPPNGFENRFARALLNHWGLDDRFAVRTGFPVTLSGPGYLDPVTGQALFAGLNLVQGQPVYLYGTNCASVLQGSGHLGKGQGCPGGRAVNPNAFTLPAGCTLFFCSPGNGVGNAPRNFVRGFGAWQMDVAVRREFPVYERLKLQFRAEAFNIFNHPSFGTIDPNLGDPLFGQATATLARSIGVLSPLYQMGGPRSMQFALKLIF